MNEKIYIRCEFQQMAQSEVLDMIPKDTLSRIQANDPHPSFRVFSIGHEGDANANVLGMGQRVLRYAKDLIVQMFNKVKLGLPAFNRHDPTTNDHTNRETVGEIVGKTMKTIGGRLHTLAAVYISPQFRDKDLDIASIEGYFSGEERSDGSTDVVNLSDITGLALSNHAIDTPGMPGATLQAALQMFTQKHGRIQQMETKDEVKAAIIKLNLKPEDVFEEDALVSSEPAKKAKQQEYEHAKRLEKRLGDSREENTKLQGDMTKLQDENNQLKTQANQAQVGTTFETLVTEKKYDSKFVTYVKKGLDKFKTEKTGDEFKSELAKFVDGQAEDYKAFAKDMGIQDPKITSEDKGGKADEKGKGGPGTPSSDGGNDQETEVGSEFEDPAKNDFIPQA